MEVFINECSLHNQYFDIGEFQQGVQLIYSLVQELSKVKQISTKTLYTDKEGIKRINVIKSQSFIASLNGLSDKSLRQAFVGLVFNRLNARDWHEDQRHSNDDLFVCSNELITSTSIAEITERILIQKEYIGLLLNFHKSKYAAMPRLRVIKNETIDVFVSCTDSKHILQRWLEQTFKLSYYEYDNNSSIPPTDEQTILRNSNRFQVTMLSPYNGRKIYREVQVNRYWYVDNLHYGGAAHLEVFDLQGKHLGEANLTGDLDATKRDPKKRLTM